MIIYRELGNVLQFLQSLNSSRKSFNLINQLNLVQTVRVSRLVENVNNLLSLRHTVSYSWGLKNISLGNQLVLNQDISHGDSISLITYLQLAHSVTIITPLSNILNLTQNISLYKPKSSRSSLSLSQGVEFKLIKKKNMANNIVLKNRVRYQKLRNGKENLCESQLDFGLEPIEGEN